MNDNNNSKEQIFGFQEYSRVLAATKNLFKRLDFLPNKNIIN